MKRRDFLGIIWQGIGALAAAGMGFIGVRFLSSQDRESASGGVIMVGSVESFSPGTVTPIPEGKCYLVRNAEGGFLALYRQCTHLSCMVIWEQDQFRCPCHGSAFTMEGKVITPPASSALSCFAVQIENGQVQIDTNRQIKRTKTTAEDFVYPSEQPA